MIDIIGPCWLLSIEEYAQRMGISAATAKRDCEDGRTVVARKVGRTWVIIQPKGSVALKEDSAELRKAP